MSYTDEFCAQVASIQSSILITAWLNNSKGIAWHLAPRAPVPADERAATVGPQVELIRSIVQTSEDIFGSSWHILSSLERVDSYDFVSKDCRPRVLKGHCAAL